WVCGVDGRRGRPATQRRDRDRSRLLRGAGSARAAQPGDAAAISSCCRRCTCDRRRTTDEGNTVTLIERLRAMRDGDVPTHGGRTLAYVYDSGLAEADEIGREALAMFASSNGLDPTAFPSLLTMENDLVDRAARLLDAPDSAVGTVTS